MIAMNSLKKHADRLNLHGYLMGEMAQAFAPFLIAFPAQPENFHPLKDSLSSPH